MLFICKLYNIYHVNGFTLLINKNAFFYIHSMLMALYHFSTLDTSTVEYLTCLQQSSAELSTSREATHNTRVWPSMALQWRGWAALNSWRCTSVRTSHGPPTPHHWHRRPNSASTSYASAPRPILTMFSRWTVTKHPFQLHHCVGRELHWLQQENPTVHCEHSCQDYWNNTPIPTRHLHHPPHSKSHPNCDILFLFALSVH